MQNEKTYTVLIVEDDEDIVEVLKMYLTNSGFFVLEAENGNRALEIIEKSNVDLCLVDIMMPQMNGFELIGKIRTFAHLPIIIVSAKKEDSDKILGLDIGADDYITKPFNPLEVIARVNAVLRRSYTFAKRTSNELTFHDLRLNRETMRFYRNDEEIALTPTEFKIMTLLMQQPGRVFTKEQIALHVNGVYFETDENTIMVHMSNLREKIEEDWHTPTRLLTVRGLGYKLGWKADKKPR